MLLVFLIFVRKAENLSKKISALYRRGMLHKACQCNVLSIVYGREVSYLRDKYFAISWQKRWEWAFEVKTPSPASKCFHVLPLAVT